MTDFFRTAGLGNAPHIAPPPLSFIVSFERLKLTNVPPTYTTLSRRYKDAAPRTKKDH
jgi:hypothetical protein